MATSALAPLQAEAQQQPEKVKILLIDDSPENLVALEAALECLGQDLVKATSGLEALRYLLDDDFAAILLDVKMPDMDGFETASLIRARRRSQHTPILFLTAYKNEEHLFRGYDLGAVDFLFKPIVPEILQSKVAVFVELSRNSALLRKQAAALRKTEQQFRALLEAAPDAMVITDEQGRIVLINTKTETVFQRDRSELLGKHASLLVPEWELGKLAEIVPGSPGAEMTAIDGEGRRFPVEVTNSPVNTETGIVFISAIRDITSRKKVEAAIRELNTELENRVAERTAELLRSNEELRQFAYVASHDLKEPLRMVSSYTQLIARKLGHDLEDDIKEYMAFVLQGVTRMHSLIEDLLTYSRVDAGESAFGPANLADAVSEACVALRLSIHETGADVVCGNLPTVRADHAQLVQLFQNLIGNAIKYRSEAPPRVNVEAMRAGPLWTVSVQDNGIGFAPQYGETIFKLFKRLHVREQYPGNGVGLAICKKIVERHGGKIWAESEQGVGSAFLFTLPDRA